MAAAASHPFEEAQYDQVTATRMENILAYASSEDENDGDIHYVAPSHPVFENISGLYPTFVYFPVSVDAAMRVIIDDALDAIVGFAASVLPLENLHVSVSGNLMLRRDQASHFNRVSLMLFCVSVTMPLQCDGFLRLLGKRLLEIPFVDAQLSSVVMLPSQDTVSTFAAFPLQVPTAFFRSICSCLDFVCAAFSLPSQSLSPLPHMSFARLSTPLRHLSTIPGLKHTITLPRVSKVSLRCVHVNIGNRRHILPLSEV